MKPGLKAGEQFEFSIQVREDMQPQFEGTLIHPLYSTAAMLNHMEWAARQHILPYLEPGEESVGYHIDLKHLAPTPLGATVTIRSTVTQVGRTKVVSQVEAWHQTSKIGEGLLTQALVPTHKLYPQLAQQTENEPNNPPPAELLATDGKSGFELEIVKWETGQFPCSRYDEWLICEVTAFHNGQKQTLKGPFLLRHELEEWMSAAKKLGTGQGGRFQSDFLEPVIRIELIAGEPGVCQHILQLSQVGDQPQDKQNTLTLRMDVSEKMLTHFANQLEDQLEGFPSRL